MNKKTATILKVVFGIVLIVLLVVLIAQLFTAGNKPDQLTFGGEGGLEQKIRNGEIKSIYVEGGYTVKVLYNTGSKIKEDRKSVV